MRKENPKNLSEYLPEEIDRILKDLLNKCKLIEPDYMPITEVADYEGKKFIVIWAPGGAVRPYSSPKRLGDNSNRTWFIRKMASTVEPSEEEIKELFSLAANVPFDDRVNHFATLNDLRRDLIEKHLRDIGSSLVEKLPEMSLAELCRSMNLINSLPEYEKPKNVALMFFSPNPEKFFPYAQIDVVEFPEGAEGDIIREKTFRGPLNLQLSDALAYIENNYIQHTIIKQHDRPQAKSFYNYPYIAIKEALSNAVYHKGYDVREPIEVRIFKDRIEILSYPGPDRSVTIDGLRNYQVFSRRYRNRRIGEFLKELHLTEGRNTGFRKILGALDSNGSPKPLFQTDEYHSFFGTTFFIRTEANCNMKDVGDTFGSNVGSNVGSYSDVEQYNKLSVLEAKILEALKINGRLKIKELMTITGNSERSIHRAINSLKKNKLIERVGSSRKGHWIVL